MDGKKLFNDRLRELRDSSKLKQEEFADKAGVSQQTISNWEKKSNITIDGLIKLAKNFNVSLDWLLGLSDYRTPEEQQNNLLNKIPDKLTCKYVIDFIEKLYDTEIIKAYVCDNEYCGLGNGNSNILLIREQVLRAVIAKLHHYKSQNDEFGYNMALDKIMMDIGDKELLCLSSLYPESKNEEEFEQNIIDEINMVESIIKEVQGTDR